MRPYIICHMMASIDGRIDCSMTEQLPDVEAYYDTLDSLDTPSHLSGKTTMIMHNAAPGKFESDDNTPIGKTAFHKAIDAEAYTISVDTKGELLWDSDIVEDLPLICIVSEKASTEYLHYLESKHISWIAAGENHIDLCSAAEILYSEFGIKRMAIVGGGTINAAFMQAGLIDEISVLIGAGVDGRSGQTSVFDGIKDDKKSVTTFSLISAERYNDTSCVWIKYRSK